MKLHQLLSEGPLAQAFQKGMQNPGATIKQTIQSGSAVARSKSPVTADRPSSPYDMISDDKIMKDIIKRVLNKQDLEPYQIKLLRDLDQRL